jgi:hypothetical protein
MLAKRGALAWYIEMVMELPSGLRERAFYFLQAMLLGT